ncbi:MAG: hypothetical protein IKX20_04820 [Paludibacteraceae bacterium]|nr:hypothetical protein [Paludibacteraceae bacterium]
MRKILSIFAAMLVALAVNAQGTDFAAPGYSCAADDGVISGDAPAEKVFLHSTDDPHYIGWSDVSKSYTAVVSWTVTATRACYISVGLDLGPVIGSNKHIFEVKLLDADSNELGALEEGPAYTGDGFTESEQVKALTGKLLIPAPGVYTIELRNNRDFCKGTIKNVILTYAGDAPITDFAAPGYSCAADDAVISGDAPANKVYLQSETDPHYIGWSDVSKSYTAEISWKIMATRGCYVSVDLDLGPAISSNKHIFEVQLLDEEGNKLDTIAEGPAYTGDGFTQADQVKTLEGTLLVPKAGIYTVVLKNNRDFCKGSIKNVILTYAADAPLEPKTFYGATSFVTEGNYSGNWNAVEWNITRNADKTLTAVVEWSGEIVGAVPQLKIGDGNFTNMTVEGKKGTLTTTATYEDGNDLNVEFYIAYAGAAKSIPVTYTVGSENEKPATPVEPVAVPAEFEIDMQSDVLGSEGAAVKRWLVVGEPNAFEAAAPAEYNAILEAQGFTASHGYHQLVATVPVEAGDYRVTLGKCQYAYSADYTMAYVKDEENQTLASVKQNTTSEEEGGVCYHQNTTTNVVTMEFTVDAAQTLKILCAHYTPYIKVEKVVKKSLSEFIADKPATEVTLKDLTVLFATGKNTYVIDEEGVALVIFDNGKTYYDGTLTAGKVLSGQKATYTAYKNQDEIIPTNTAAISDGTVATPTTLSEFPTTANVNQYVRLENLDAKADGGKYYVANGENAKALQLYGATGDLKPSKDGIFNVEGIIINFNNTQLEIIVLAIEEVKFGIVIADCANGALASDKTEAGVGETVTLTITPVEGYELDELTVTGVAAADITIDGNTATFAMPAQNVEASATFKVAVGTGMDNTNSVKVTKAVENGQLIIIKNGVKYNAQGAVVR